jgi:hypothetical protein
LKSKLSEERKTCSAAFSKLNKLKTKFVVLREENDALRRFYTKNIYEYNKKDVFEKEVDEIYNDFNKAINARGNFIKKHIDTLEKTVEGFTYCKSKILRDYIGRDL